jgi:hypothetical protein
MVDYHFLQCTTLLVIAKVVLDSEVAYFGPIPSIFIKFDSSVSKSFANKSIVRRANDS